MNDLVKHDPNADPFAVYAKTVSNQHILGQLLKFSKGDYVAGEGATPVPRGTRLVCNMDSLLAGWIKWHDNRPVEHVMGLVAQGAVMPLRNELGDNDKDDWELDEDGKARDPWQRANYILMKAEDGAIPDERPVGDPLYGIYTFTASSQGGLSAIAKVCQAYNLDMRRQRPDMYPVVELGVDSYLHNNRAFGRIKKPLLTVVDWAPKSLFPSHPSPDANTAAPIAGAGNGGEAPRVAAPKAAAAGVQQPKPTPLPAAPPPPPARAKPRF